MSSPDTLVAEAAALPSWRARWMGVRLLILAVACGLLLLVAGVRTADAASPGWQVLSVTGPTNLKPFSSEQQTVTGALLGMYTLTFRGDTTVPLAGTASADDLAAALNALPSIAAGGGSVSVRSATGDTTASTYVVTFDGGPLAGTDVPLMSATGGFFVPASVSPTPAGTIAVFATNVGGALTAGPITASITLPDGITTTATAAGTGQTIGAGWSCTPAGSGQSTVSCTTTNTVAPGTNAQAIGVPVQVAPGVSGTKTARVTVSGGGAAVPATYDEPITISDTPASAGVQAFWAGAFDEDGKPATQAGGHPYQAITGFLLNTIRAGDGSVTPAGDLKNARVDLPPGFIGNPQAASKCPESGTYRNCSTDAIVGLANPIFSYFGQQFKANYMVFQTTPDRGDAAQFVFNALSAPTVLTGSVRSDGDFGLAVTAANTPQKLKVFGAFVSLWGVPGDPSHDPYRCSSTGVGVGAASFQQGGTCTSPNANSNQQAFLSNPTDCAAEALSPPVTVLGVNSYQHPDVFSSASYGSPPVTNCGALPFAPSMSVLPTVASADAPTGLDVQMHFPQDGLTDRDGLATAHLKKATVTLPVGLTISPGAANGLAACSDADLKLKSLAPVSCPDAAKIGTATATTPLLAETLTGSVYMRTQNSMDPESGEMFRIALVLESKERGVSVRLPGEIRADAYTGRLTATFDNNPRLPVSDLKLRFKGGSTAPLATPKTCGAHRITAALTSWGGQSARLPSTFKIGCTPGLGWFGPFFSAGTTSPIAGASTSFVLRMHKPDGQSDMNGISLELPEGLLASLKGNIGRQIGTASVGAGPGPTPFWLSGPVVLEGPYGDAPFSLRVTVPVVAGPFNLGNVVVRQKIYVDPHDAHVTVVSDPLPTIVKGVPVRLQDLAVNIDKAGFMRNPTSCAVKRIDGALGAMTGQVVTVASRFQVGNCAKLPLRPKMQMELTGDDQVKRGKHPTLSTVLTQQPGESNLKSVKVRLPLSLALDPDNAQALCKPGQAAAHACPAGSIVGKATAISPVLNRPLAGNVYFVEGTRKSKEGRTVKTLPRLWVALRGEVAIDVWADSSISKGKYLVTTFPFVPDAPISAFKLDITGGEHGILAVTGDSDANLCQRRLITNAEYEGQNGKQVKTRVHMDSPCGFRVRKKSVSRSHARVTVSGLGSVEAPGAGKLTISGKGIHKAKRTIKHSNVATIRPRLTATGKRLYRGRKAIRLKVSWNPKAKGEKTRHDRTTVKRATKKSSSSSRGHRLSRSR